MGSGPAGDGDGDGCHRQRRDPWDEPVDLIRSLQIGKAVPVIAVTSVAANLFTIAAGPVVFAEPMPDTSLGVVARLLAFALVISAAALTPAPVRAVEPDPAR